MKSTSEAASLDGFSVDQYPSLAKLGQGPKWNWEDTEIVDRYESAFDVYIVDGIAGRLADGTAAGPTRFWVEVRGRARELMPGRDVRPGRDYALTEAVRCKSRGEHGVRDALATCSERYLGRTLEASGASVVVALGRIAADAMSMQFGLSSTTRLQEGVLIGGRERIVVFLPHPNARARRTFEANIGSAGLDRLRGLLREEIRSRESLD